jgi:hypothetical protein
LVIQFAKLDKRSAPNVTNMPRASDKAECRTQPADDMRGPETVGQQRGRLGFEGKDTTCLPRGRSA